jgi:hypothetical protein
MYPDPFHWKDMMQVYVTIIQILGYYIVNSFSDT